MCKISQVQKITLLLYDNETQRLINPAIASPLTASPNNCETLQDYVNLLNKNTKLFVGGCVNKTLIFFTLIDGVSKVRE